MRILTLKALATLLGGLLAVYRLVLVPAHRLEAWITRGADWAEVEHLLAVMQRHVHRGPGERR